jgi:hypothetical protein
MERKLICLDPEDEAGLDDAARREGTTGFGSPPGTRATFDPIVSLS